MIKVLAPAQMHPGRRTLAEFQNYWAESHGPLVRQHEVPASLRAAPDAARGVRRSTRRRPSTASPCSGTTTCGTSARPRDDPEVDGAAPGRARGRRAAVRPAARLAPAPQARVRGGRREGHRRRPDDAGDGQGDLHRHQDARPVARRVLRPLAERARPAGLEGAGPTSLCPEPRRARRLRHDRHPDARRLGRDVVRRPGVAAGGAQVA